MNFKIGKFIDDKLKERGMSKKELYDKIKSTFHADEDYIKYKGFTARFYSKLYASDILEIAMILNIDLNEMKSFLMDEDKKEGLFEIEDVLSKSKYANSSKSKLSKWICVEGDFVYIVWHSLLGGEILDIYVEMYNIKSGVIYDISCLTCLAIMKIDKAWDSKSFESKMHSIKDLNKRFFSEMYA